MEQEWSCDQFGHMYKWLCEYYPNQLDVFHVSSDQLFPKRGLKVNIRKRFWTRLVGKIKEFWNEEIVSPKCTKKAGI